MPGDGHTSLGTAADNGRSLVVTIVRMWPIPSNLPLLDVTEHMHFFPRAKMQQLTQLFDLTILVLAFLKLIYRGLPIRAYAELCGDLLHQVGRSSFWKQNVCLTEHEIFNIWIWPRLIAIKLIFACCIKGTQ